MKKKKKKELKAKSFFSKEQLNILTNSEANC